MCNTTNSCEKEATLTKSTKNILCKIGTLQTSLPKPNADIASQLYDLRLTLQVELGKVFLLVQDLASLSRSIVGTVDMCINEISLRLLTLIGSCKIILDQEDTDRDIDTLKNLDNDFINLSDSLLTLIDYVHVLTYSECRDSILVVNLEGVLKMILLTINGSVYLCKELLVYAKVTVSSTIIDLCKNLENACNLSKQGATAISVSRDLSYKLDVDVNLKNFKPVFENVVNDTMANINLLSVILETSKASKSSIQKLKTYAVTMLSAMQEISDIFVSVKITQSQDYNLRVSMTNLLRSMNSLTIYLIKICTKTSTDTDINLYDSTKKFRIMFMDITANYESFFRAVFRMSVSYAIRVFNATDFKKTSTLPDIIKVIHKKLGAVALSSKNLVRSVLNVIEVSLRSSMIITRIKEKKCLTSLNEFTNDLSTMLHNLDDINIYHGIYILYFGSGPSAIGPLSACSARFVLIVEATIKYLLKLDTVMEIIYRRVNCSLQVKHHEL